MAATFSRLADGNLETAKAVAQRISEERRVAVGVKAVTVEMLPAENFQERLMQMTATSKEADGLTKPTLTVYHIHESLIDGEEYVFIAKEDHLRRSDRR